MTRPEQVHPELNGKTVEYVIVEADGSVVVCFTDRSELWVDRCGEYRPPQLRVNLP